VVWESPKIDTTIAIKAATIPTQMITQHVLALLRKKQEMMKLFQEPMAQCVTICHSGVLNVKKGTSGKQLLQPSTQKRDTIIHDGCFLLDAT